MSNSQNKNNANGDDGNSDNRRQGLRRESEWRKILNRANQETARFLKIYEESFLLPKEEQENNDRLDSCAIAMSWSVRDDDEPDSDDEISLDGNDDKPADAGTPAFPPVYSLHNLPESIAIAALFQFMKKCQLEFSREQAFPTANLVVMENALGDAYRSMFLAIASEFGLTICLMKDAHSALNKYLQGFRFLRTKKSGQHLKIVKKRALCAVLDLRDMCLRIMRNARNEMAKNG